MGLKIERPRARCRKFTKMDVILCLFLCFSPIFAAKLPSDMTLVYSDNSIRSDAKNYNFTRSENYLRNDQSYSIIRRSFSTEDASVGRTFGPRFKKMLQALVPLAFNLGMASTWAVVAALVGIKTLGVTLLILKLLLLAGAAKVGAFFASKVHPAPAKWEPQKEIHLHIHNGHHDEEHIPIAPVGAWSREGQVGDTKHIDAPFSPYPGPQTISTPYGNYVRVEPGQPLPAMMPTFPQTNHQR
ncbi:uncharacterized protein LOC121739666 [Aricia agestis]|uniref:uncharacterized protein LOC121739666 n=1 Tax=Aricia agestis TaxID=91739 RepID=UPI001C208D3A|nr:uncharacterized protein LOC121739666 [Aricia agestis]